MDSRKPITTDRSISSHKAESKEYLVSVRGRPKLYLMVRPNETKSWIFRYKSPINGKPQRISLGTYPAISFARACEIWQDYENMLSQQLDPKMQREAEKRSQQESERRKSEFGYYADLYFDSIRFTLKPNTLGRKRNAINLLCESLGERHIDDITPPQMLEVLLDIQQRFPQRNGRPSEKAERCAAIASDIFTYALARGHCRSNPALLIKSQLARPAYGHRPALIKPAEFGKLLQDIATLEHRVDRNTYSSLQLLPMLMVRNGDLRRMRWKDIDFDECKWRFQPLKGEGKEHMVREIIVPLPRQAIQILKLQYEINGHTDLVFFSETARRHHIISENTANDRLKDLGYQDRHCVHGFRASAKTMLQEQLKYPAVLVEMGLGHITKDQNGSAYGRFDFLEDRIEMMQTWADYLDALRLGEDVTRFKNRLQTPATNPDAIRLAEQLIKQLGKDQIKALLDKL